MINTGGDGDAVLNLLEKLQFDINAYDSAGYTLMHYAASLGYDDCIYSLFKSGANLEEVALVLLKIFDFI